MQRLSCDITKYYTSDTSYNIVYQLLGIWEGDLEVGAASEEKWLCDRLDVLAGFYLAQLCYLLTWNLL